MEVNNLAVGEEFPRWPRFVERKVCGRIDGEKNSRRRGGSRSSKCRHGDKWEDLQER